MPTFLKKKQKPLFSLGNSVYLTVGAGDAFDRIYGNNSFAKIDELIARHASGDWGDLDDSDKAQNDAAVKNGRRIFSAYQVTDDLKVWIITEADRSHTTVLLPSEY